MPPPSDRVPARVAVVAAALASVGDLLLLWVATTARGAGSDVLLAWMLLAGHHLGVLAIPFYALGYWRVSTAITRPELARLVLAAGALGSALGAAIHGITGIAIAAERTQVRATPPVPAAPFAGMAGADVITPYAEFLVPLWIVVGVALIAGSLAFTIAVASGASHYRRWIAALSPAALIVLIGVVGGLLPGKSLIVPAAPNLAHLVFFALAAWPGSRIIDARGAIR